MTAHKQLSPTISLIDLLKDNMRSTHQVLLLLLLRGRYNHSCTGFSNRVFNNLTTKAHVASSSRFFQMNSTTSTTNNSSSSTTRSASNNNNNKNNNKNNEQLIFGKFKISPEQIFYTSSTNLSAAIVNLRPIVPGHVLVIPKRIVPKISQLHTDEYIDLWDSVRKVQNALEKHYEAEGFNIAIQDGKAAGQSVPHVHVHILPRVDGDFERNDDVYDELENWAPTDDIAMKKQMEKEEHGNKLDVPEDEDRKDRTMQDMEDEASIYRELLSLAKSPQEETTES